MKIGLCVDDNSGFSIEEARDLDLGVVRMPISIDGKTFYQNVNLDPQEFYNGLIDKDVHTSMPSPADTMKVWTICCQDMIISSMNLCLPVFLPHAWPPKDWQRWMNIKER